MKMMKRLKTSALFLLLLFQLFFQQCARETTQIIYPTTLEDTDTPDELNTWIEQQTPVSTPLDKLILPNGRSIETFLKEYEKKYKSGRITADALSPEDQKNMIIAGMGVVAQRLCNRDNFVYKEEATDAPAQKGLAYSYGQDDYTKRLFQKTPVCTKDAPCPYRLFGLDCSGFITNLLREATDPVTKMPLFTSVPRGVSSTQGTEKFWNDILKQNKKFARIEVKKKGKLEVGKIESGDIIQWSGHIAYVFTGSDGKLKVFQSNGKSSDVNKRNGGADCKDARKSSCDCPGIEFGACETNYKSAGRGVHEFETPEDAIKTFGGSYQILRFTTKLGGKWRLQLKCDWAADDDVAVVFNLNLPDIEDGKKFSVDTVGKDYDGKNLYVTFQGTYDAHSRKLNGELFTADDFSPEIRIDNIRELTLPNGAEPTKWTDLANVQRQPNTCIVQIKLERISAEGSMRQSFPTLSKQSIFR